MTYAFWNNGMPRVLRSDLNVALPDGGVVLRVVRSMPERDLYAYEVRGVAPAAHERTTTTRFTREGGTIVATCGVEERPLAEVGAEKLTGLAAHRYSIETGGVTAVGFHIRTDRESQALIASAAFAARSALEAGEPYWLNWKTESGWARWDAAQIIAVAHAVRCHVQACFDVERVHTEAIGRLASAADIAAYDITKGWS